MPCRSDQVHKTTPLADEKNKIMKKIKGLDSLRFFAFLSVFLFHTAQMPYGFLGVDFFFVLSSFLLTYLAFKEIERTGGFSKRNFFMRRALRIFPLYYWVVFFSFIILPSVAAALGLRATLPENPYLYYFFLSNYEDSNCIFALLFLWSISVEEQFYLIFVICSALFKNHLWLFVLLLFVVYTIFMFVAEDYGFSTYSNTIAHFSNFMLGIMTGYAFFKKINLPTKLLLPLLLIVLTLLFTLSLNDFIFKLLVAFCFAALILLFIKAAAYVENFSLFKLTEYLGEFSFGLYVYSGFAITFGLKYIKVENLYVLILLEFIILFALSFLSYHLYEKQFLKLKKYFRSGGK